MSRWCNKKALTCLLMIYIYLINSDADIKWWMLFALTWETTHRPKVKLEVHLLACSGAFSCITQASPQQQSLLTCQRTADVFMTLRSICLWKLVDMAGTRNKSTLSGDLFLPGKLFSKSRMNCRASICQLCLAPVYAFTFDPRDFGKRRRSFSNTYQTLQRLF